MTASPAIFLDRDGTLVRDFMHGADPAALTLLPGVVEALRALAGAGFRLVVVTNQAGVARGKFTVAEAKGTGVRVAALLGAAGIRLSGYYLSPYHAAGTVPRYAIAHPDRKPGPGMLLRAAADQDLDLARSWIVGDSLADVEAGLAAGTGAILVDIGSVAIPPHADPPACLAHPRAAIARNLPHAAAVVLGRAAPCAVDVLRRASAPPDTRRTGQPSRWPDEGRMAEAAAEARMGCDPAGE